MITCTHHEGVPLARKDLNLVNRVRLTVDAIDFDDGHVVVVDGKHEIGITGHRDQSDAIPEHKVNFVNVSAYGAHSIKDSPLAKLNVDHREVRSGTVRITALTIDQRGIELWWNTYWLLLCQDVVPVGQSDDGAVYRADWRDKNKSFKLERTLNMRVRHTIIDIVAVCVGIVRVVNNQGTPESIAVLSRQVTVVPVRPCNHL